MEHAGRHTPIIALTASMTKDIREKRLEAGMNKHMAKPLDMRKFRMRLYSLHSSEASVTR